MKKKTSIYEWCKRFQDGRANVKDDERVGHANTPRIDKNMQKVAKMIKNDRRIIIIRKVADKVLGTKRMSAKVVLKLMNFK